MKIRCVHGYFFIEETRKGDIADFSQIFGLTIVPKENYFTFPLLKDAPDYSLVGLSYLGVNANKTYEGRPWEVMRQNALVYDFNQGILVPFRQVPTRLSITLAQNYYFSIGLIMPGSFDSDGRRALDYSCFVDFVAMKFIYTGISYG